MLLRVVLSGFLLLTPIAATADAVLTVESDFSGSFSIGLGGVQMGTGIFGGRFPDPVGDSVYDFNGTMELTSGPLLDLTFDTTAGGIPISRYTFGPGVLTMQLFVIPAEGGPVIVAGDLVVAVPQMMFSVLEQFPGFGFISDEIQLGPGEFDDSLAPVFGHSGRLEGGTLQVFIEVIPGGPSDVSRVGEIDFARAQLAIPEPGATCLLIGGAAAARLRRRRADARASSV